MYAVKYHHPKHPNTPKLSRTTKPALDLHLTDPIPSPQSMSMIWCTPVLIPHPPSSVKTKQTLCWGVSTVSLRSPLTLSANLQWLSDFLPFNIRRRMTSMPPRELIRLIQPWVRFRLRFFGWYSVPRFRVRTCWYCHGSWGNTPEPSACTCRGPHLQPWGPADGRESTQELSDLRWDNPLSECFGAAVTLLTDHTISTLWKG